MSRHRLWRGFPIDAFVKIVYILHRFVLYTFPHGFEWGCMGKVAAALLGSIIGGFAAVGAIVFWFGWGLP